MSAAPKLAGRLTDYEELELTSIASQVRVLQLALQGPCDCQADTDALQAAAFAAMVRIEALRDQLRKPVKL